MSVKPVVLPCNCWTEVDTATFKTGERGVTCPRHERSFIIGAVMPTEPDHRVVREIPYVAPQEGQQ